MKFVQGVQHHSRATWPTLAVLLPVRVGARILRGVIPLLQDVLRFLLRPVFVDCVSSELQLRALKSRATSFEKASRLPATRMTYTARHNMRQKHATVRNKKNITGVKADRSRADRKELRCFTTRVLDMELPSAFFCSCALCVVFAFCVFLFAFF